MFIFCMILRCVVHVTISFVCWKGHIVSNDTQHLFYAYVFISFCKKNNNKKSSKTKSKTDFILCLFLLTCYPHQHEYHRH